MKRLGILTLVLSMHVAFSPVVTAQVCFNGMSTNPANAYNNDPSYPTSNNLWLNTFDFGANNGFGFSDIFLNPNAGWAIPDFTSTAQFQMFSPFTSAGAPGSPFLSQPVFDKRDFHWEDGWELLYLGTGNYPNGWPLNLAPSGAPVSTPSSAYDGRIPYLIYYNRYQGLIRLFAGLFTPFGTVQSLSVDLTMNSGQLLFSSTEAYSGLLRHLGTYDSPLDVPTNFRAQRGVNATGYQSGTSFNPKVWYVYDFQVGYDPCTCFNPSGKFNKLNFEFTAVQSSTLELYGRMITLEESIVDDAGNVTYNQDFLTASSIQAQDPNGYILRSSLDGLAEDYRESLRIYNEQLEDRQFGRSGWFRDVLGDLQSTIVGAGVDLIPGGEIAQWLVKKKLTLGADSADINKLVKSGSKSLLSGGYNFLSNQIFGENVNPVRPSRPVASFSEMRFSGEIQAVNPSTLAGFWTPGSNYVGNDWTAYYYPSYNEVLGLYATLRTPEVAYLDLPGAINTSTTGTETALDSTWNIGTSPSPCFVGVDGYNLDSIITKVRNQSQDIYVKLKNPLSYALNPAVDMNMDKTKIYLSYVITLENGDVVAQPSSPSGYNLIDSLVVEEASNTNLWLLHDISQSQNAFKKGTDRRLTLSAGWFEVENTTNLLFGSSLNTRLHYREKYERFTPVCGGSADFDSFVPAILSTALEFKPVKIEVKVMADMYFDQLSFTGEEINTTQVFTYLLLDTEQDIDLIDEQGNYIIPSEANDFIQMFPGELTIESNIISGNSPEAYPSNENFTVFVRAENIIVDKPLSGIIAAPPSIGPLIKVQAYDAIHIKPGAHLRRNLNLLINKNIYGAPISTPTSENDVATFCNSNTYQASALNSKGFHSNSSVEIEDKTMIRKEAELNEIKIHPNPTSGLLHITSSHDPITQVEVFDLAGRKLYHQTFGHSPSRDIQADLSSLSNGVYVVRTKSGGVVSSEKLVVGR